MKMTLDTPQELYSRSGEVKGRVNQRNSGFTLKPGSCRKRISFQKFQFRFYRNRICHNKFWIRLKEPELYQKKSGSGSGSSFF